MIFKKSPINHEKSKISLISNEEHRLENLEPEPEPGEPRLKILKAWAWAYFENHEPEPEPEPKFWSPSLSLSLEPKLKYWLKYHNPKNFWNTIYY